jgi:nucleotide-binding universal stress UspA family protein
MEPFRLNRIMIPLDGSPAAEEAIAYAAPFAARGVQVVLFQVVSHVEPDRDLLGHVEHTETEEARRELALSRADLETVAQRWSAVLPTSPAIEAAVGDPAEEIVKAAERLGCDLIVAAHHGRGALSRLAFGSVADALARTSPAPVLFARPSDDGGQRAAAFTRLVAPYDGSELAARSFPVAAELARRLDLELHVIRVVSVSLALAAPPLAEPFASGVAYEAVLDELEAGAKESVAAVAATLSEAGVRVRTEVVEGGAPAEMLIERTGEGDLIVMTSHGRSGFKRLLLGSVADKLVRSGHAPVVLVPAGERQ